MNRIKTVRIAVIYDRKHNATESRPATVEIRLSYNRKQKYMSTGISLYPHEWKNDRVVRRIDQLELNEAIDDMIVNIRQICNQMAREGNIDLEQIKNKLSHVGNGDLSFIDFCQKRVKVRCYGQTKDTLFRYQRIVDFLRRWGKIEYFSDITDENILEIDEYLKNKGLKNYTKWQGYHRVINSFILDAVAEGYIKRNPYKWINIPKDKNYRLDKYLTPEEFNRIVKVKLRTQRMERIRDLFVFQTLTCLAYTDLLAFDADNIKEINGNKVYIGKRAKTNIEYTILLLPLAIDILNKYNNKLPLLSNQKYNDALKVLAQFCEIDKPLSSHWARHTGATLLLNEGKMSMENLAKVMGHSSPTMTRRVYAKLLDETVINDMSAAATRMGLR